VDRLRIEKKGGLANFGGSSAKIKSQGELNLSTLPPAQRQAVESLFGRSDLVAPRGSGDVPVYHMTRETPSGTQTIQVPENLAPDVVKKSVTDRLE
jgi:hypothetical protein